MLRQNRSSMKIAASRSPATRKCMLLIHSKSRSVVFVLMIRGSSFYQLEHCVPSEGERLVEERMVVLVQGGEMVIGETSGFYLGSDAIWGIWDVTEGNQGFQCSYKTLQSNVYVSCLVQRCKKRKEKKRCILQCFAPRRFKERDKKNNNNNKYVNSYCSSVNMTQMTDFILTLNLVICLKHLFIFFNW